MPIGRLAYRQRLTRCAIFFHVAAAAASWDDLSSTEAVGRQDDGVLAVVAKLGVQRETTSHARASRDDGCIMGVLLVPDSDREHEPDLAPLGFVLRHDSLVTIHDTPLDIGVAELKAACRDLDVPAKMFLRLLDAVGDAHFMLTQQLTSEIVQIGNDAEEEGADLDTVRRALKRQQDRVVALHQNLGKLRHVADDIGDNRLEVGPDEVVAEDLEDDFREVRDEIDNTLRSVEFAMSLVGATRDYLQTTIALNQNRRMEILTVIASIVLVPTLIVGLYGENFKLWPGEGSRVGFVISLALIAFVTVVQLFIFWHFKWIGNRKRKDA